MQCPVWLFALVPIIVIIIIIIITVIIILVIAYMQGIYNYIRETNLVYRVHSVTAVLYLQFVLHWMLFRTWNMCCAFTSTLPAVCVQCTIWLLFVVPLFRAFPVCCSGIVWVILQWFQSLLLIIIIIIIIIIISFMQGIYTYIPETVSLRNTVLQLFCCYYSWCLYR